MSAARPSSQTEAFAIPAISSRRSPGGRLRHDRILFAERRKAPARWSFPWTFLQELQGNGVAWSHEGRLQQRPLLPEGSSAESSSRKALRGWGVQGASGRVMYQLTEACAPGWVCSAATVESFRQGQIRSNFFRVGQESHPHDVGRYKGSPNYWVE
jgi:hypothetical protein